MSTSILRSKSFAFAVKIVRLVRRLQSEKKEYVLSNQLLRSGTSPGSLFREAEFAQSKKDFINKVSIALKEANESEYFLRLLQATGFEHDQEISGLFKECGEIKAMSISSIKTAKSNLAKQLGLKMLFALLLFTFLFSLFTFLFSLFTSTF
jgi:four helix bundle protein